MEEVEISQIQISFLVLMAVFAFVTLILTRMKLPDIEGTKAEAGEKLEKSVWSFSHLTLGVIAIFFYVGVEVCVGANINLYAIELENWDINSSSWEWMPLLLEVLILLFPH